MSSDPFDPRVELWPPLTIVDFEDLRRRARGVSFETQYQCLQTSIYINNGAVEHESQIEPGTYELYLTSAKRPTEVRIVDEVFPYPEPGENFVEWRVKYRIVRMPHPAHIGAIGPKSSGPSVGKRVHVCTRGEFFRWLNQ